MAILAALASLVSTVVGGLVTARVGDRRHLIQLPPLAVGLYLGYFAGVLLYLATADILPEAHAEHESLGTLGATVAGAALMWAVVGFSR